MFLKRIFAPVGNSLFNRRARAQHTPAEECVILKRLRELMEVTSQVPPTLPGVEGGEGEPQLGGA